MTPVLHRMGSMIRAAVSWPLAARKASRAGVSFQGSTATSSAAACDCPALGRWGRGASARPAASSGGCTLTRMVSNQPW